MSSLTSKYYAFSPHTLCLRVPRNSSNNSDYFCIQNQTIGISKRNTQFSLQQQQQQQQHFKYLKFLFNINSYKLRKSEICLKFVRTAQ